MKTHTEFLGSQLKEISKLRSEMIRSLGDLPKETKPAEPQAPATETSSETPEAEAAVPSTSEESSELKTEITSPEAQVIESTPEPISAEATPTESKQDKPTETSAEPKEAARADSSKPEVPSTEKTEPKKKSAKDLENETRQKEWDAKYQQIKPKLVEEIKTKFKWEETRLDQAFIALGCVDRKKILNLRKITVFKSESEDEKLPKGGKKIDEFVYVPEYLFFGKPDEKKSFDKDHKGKKKGNRGKGKFDKNKKFSKKPDEKKPFTKPKTKVPTSTKLTAK